MTIPETILALSGSPELSVLFKATVLLTLALAVVRLAGRARASVRHLVLASTFAASDCASAGDCVRARNPHRFRRQTFEAGADHRDGAGSLGTRASRLLRPYQSGPGWCLSWKEILRAVWIGGAMLQFGFLAWQLCGCAAFDAPESRGWKGASLCADWLANAASENRSMSCCTRTSWPRSLAAACVQ